MLKDKQFAADGQHAKQFIQLGVGRSSVGKQSQSASKKSSNHHVGQTRGRAEDDDL